MEKEANRSHMNKKWFKTKKNSLNEVLECPKRGDFKKEIDDLIMMLSRVFGKKYSAYFKEWMVPFIETILDGRKQFDWGMILSDNLQNHMLKVGKTKNFFMNSYVIYLGTWMGIFPRLNAIGILGEAPRQKNAWEYYDQLNLHSSIEGLMMHSSMSILIDWQEMLDIG